jgi:hypothetical protein
MEIEIAREEIENILKDRALKMMQITGGTLDFNSCHWKDYNQPSGFVVVIDIKEV